MMTAWAKNLLLSDSALTRAVVRLIARPGPITMLLLVRDESDIIGQNLDFHIRYGIESFVVTDNGSIDGTKEILTEYKRRLGRSLQIIDASNEPYHQATLVNRMIHTAKESFRPGWIISADADEFWFPVSGRYDTEMDGQKNILKCHWHNFLPRADTSWQNFADVGEMPGYHGRMSKLLCLARGLHGMYIGNHNSRSIPKIEADSQNIRVYHYPIRTFAQFERKVVQGYRASVKASFQQGAAWHWGEYYSAWEKGELPKVYEELAARNRIAEDGTMAAVFGVNAGTPA